VPLHVRPPTVATPHGVHVPNDVPLDSATEKVPVVLSYSPRSARPSASGVR
jgi:hypothetical protein